MAEDISKKSQSVFQPIQFEKDVNEVLHETLRKSPVIAIKPETKIVGDKPKITNFKLYSFTGTNMKLTYMEGPVLPVSQKVTVMFEVNSLKYFALATVTDVANEIYTIAYGRLHKLQRRDTFRVALPSSLISAHFEIMRVDGLLITHKVPIIDLSAGGLGLDANEDLTALVRAGSEILGRIVIGSHSPVLCDVQVRYKRQTKSTGNRMINQIGCQYVKMQPGTADKISFLVNDCHRQIFIRTQKQ